MGERMVSIRVDGRAVTVPEHTSVLSACAAAGVRVPSLCFLEGVSSNASCGVCVVELAGAKSLIRSCVRTVEDGMDISTSSRRVDEARRTALELILANHPDDCLACPRNGSCELQSLAERFGIRRRRFPPVKALGGRAAVDGSSPSLVRDNDKCILCGRCVAVCSEVQTVAAIDFVGRGLKTKIAPFMDRGMEKSVCVRCGQCTLVCPTGALTERDETEEVFAALRDQSRKVIVQVAPAIRASLAEALGEAPGSLSTGRMVAALRRLGFYRVFDTQFTADLTIMEEGSELLERLGSQGVLPMITSCSPGWISFVETFYPRAIPHLSTCKSPQQMFGAVAKSWWAREEGLDPSSVSVVSIMPCTAKKFEAKRPEMRSAASWLASAGAPISESEKLEPIYDVDWALTTRELARMIRREGIDFSTLPDEDFDTPLGVSTGAATIFGSTGGVMEAALRTAYELVVHKPLPNLELQPVRGLESIKEATVDLSGTPLRVAVAHGLGNARTILEGIVRGTSPYHFVEIMSCPGGCVGGGGQPLLTDRTSRMGRQNALYQEDRRLAVRKSHENPAVSRLYSEFLGKPLGPLSHHLLHTTYVARRP